MSPFWVYSELLLSVPQPLSCMCWDLILAGVARTGLKPEHVTGLSHSMSEIRAGQWQPQGHPHLQTVLSQVQTDEGFCRWNIPAILMEPHGDCSTLWVLCGDYVDWHQKTVSHLCSPQDIFSCHLCYCYLCSGSKRPSKDPCSLLLNNMTGWDRDYTWELVSYTNTTEKELSESKIFDRWRSKE